jgi:hypothetical protein
MYALAVNTFWAPAKPRSDPIVVEVARLLARPRHCRSVSASAQRGILLRSIRWLGDSRTNHPCAQCRRQQKDVGRGVQ